MLERKKKNIDSNHKGFSSKFMKILIAITGDGVVESLLWKWSSYQKQPTESMHSPLNFKHKSSQKLKTSSNSYGKQRKAAKTNPEQ